jgi:hypothetical protein
MPCSTSFLMLRMLCWRVRMLSVRCWFIPGSVSGDDGAGEAVWGMARINDYRMRKLRRARNAGLSWKLVLFTCRRR